MWECKNFHSDSAKRLNKLGENEKWRTFIKTSIIRGSFKSEFLVSLSSSQTHKTSSLLLPLLLFQPYSRHARKSLTVLASFSKPPARHHRQEDSTRTKGEDDNHIYTVELLSDVIQFSFKFMCFVSTIYRVFTFTFFHALALRSLSPPSISPSIWIIISFVCVLAVIFFVCCFLSYLPDRTRNTKWWRRWFSTSLQTLSLPLQKLKCMHNYI